MFGTATKIIILILIGSLASCAKYNAQPGLLAPFLLNYLNNLGAWTKRRKITINNAAQGEALTNFPILLILNSSNIDYSQTQDNGEDIRFYDADETTLLSFEIEKWDETGNSYVWVQVPQIDASSSSDHIYMYYGNGSASDGQSPTAVWDSNYKAIMHHNGNFNDSTSNNNDGTPSGGPSNVTVSKIAGGKQFLAASSQHYTFPTTNWSIATGTVEAWAYPYTTAVANQYIFSHRMTGPDTNSRMYLLMRIGGTDFWIGVGDCYSTLSCGQTGSTLALNTWQHLVLTWDNGLFKVYLNGSVIAMVPSSYSTAEMALDTTASVGEYTNGGENFDGIIDEVRVSATARSAAWIAAEYLTMTDAYLTFGSEENL